MKANLVSRRREAHDLNNHVNQGDRASACRRRCLMSDNNAQFGFLSLNVGSVTCQARFHEPLRLGDLAAGRLCNQERLRFLHFFAIDQFKLAVRASSFFVLLSFSMFAAGRSRHWMHICALHSRQRLL